MNYYNEIKNELINNEINRKVKSYSINKSDLDAYYNVGRMLSEAGKHYGEGIIKEYSKRLTYELGKGYSKRNLWLMLKFYELNEKVQTLSAQLSWSHYCELLSFENTDKINYYIELVKNNNLSVRQLRERIKSNEYERLPESTKNKSVEQKESDIVDFIKNPILIKNSNKYDIFSEKVLQKLILEDIKNFLEELGNGFTFIKSEHPIKLGNRYNYTDLLLYNIKYRCYVVVELKIAELKKEHTGQIQNYMNYIDKNVKGIDDNKTVGIIICKQNNQYVIDYCSDDRIIAREYELVWYDIVKGVIVMEEKRHIYGKSKNKFKENTINLPDKYLMNSVNNPKYLFHGSPKKLKIIEPRESTSFNYLINNRGEAVYMTPLFVLASAYAFRDSIIKLSEKVPYNITIGVTEYAKEIYIIMDNVIVDDELEGYIYVFEWDDNYKQRKDMIQYKAHKVMPPIDIIKIKFKDFKKFYTINEANENIRK